jgi:drug/metabolite transporter (DMT)-like permease
MHEGGAPTKSMGGPSALALAAVVVANVALAFGPWFVREADTGPVAAAFWRMALGLPFIAALAWRAGARPVRMEPALWWLLLASGVAFAADLAAWHLGIRRTTLANSTLFGNTATLLFPLYGFLIARAWPTRQQGFAFALALLGGALLMGRSLDVDPRRLTGDLLCVLAGVLYTTYFIVMTRVRASMRAFSSLALSTAASMVPLLLFAWALGERVWPDIWAPLIGLALASQVVGQGCMVYALGKLSPLVVGLALLIQPVVSATLGWIIYDERLGAVDLVGAALVAIALVLVARARVAEPASRTHLMAEEAR